MIKGIDKYFKPIQIQRAIIVNDSINNPIQQWSNHIVVQGLIRQVSGTDMLLSKKETHVTSYRMYCRNADIKETDRVVYKDKMFNIVNINNVMEFDELLQIDCENNDS